MPELNFHERLQSGVSTLTGDVTVILREVDD